MRQAFVLPISIIATGIAVAALLVMFKPTPEPSPPAPEPSHIKVAVTPAIKAPARLSVTTQGTVMPAREIDVLAQVAGQIVSVQPQFTDGSFFNSGEMLIKIDDREYKAALLRAKAQVAEAELRLAQEKGLSRQAKREWRDLGNQNANDLFLRKPQLAAAKANLESARGTQAMAELDLEHTRISVPFNGRIKQRYVDLGQFTSPGNKLATVYDSTLVEIRLPLTEQQASLVDLPLLPNTDQNQQLPQVLIEGSVAGEKHKWTGVLTRTDAFVDANSRMYYAIAEVKDPYTTTQGFLAPLLPGLFVTAEIQGKNIPDVVKLPRKALFKRNKLFSLNSENKIEVNDVRVLRKTEESVWLKTALNNATLISIEKQGLTPAGSTVEPITIEAIASTEMQTVSTPVPTQLDTQGM